MLIAEAKELAEELLSSHMPQRWRHSLGVGERASRAVRILQLDDERELLVVAAILHDIGYAPALALTGLHALDGARFLADKGASRRLCGLIAHHSCAYREAELRGLSAQLAEWEDEQSALRDALWWADMTTTPNGGVTSVFDRIEEIQKRYGPEDLVSFFIRQAAPELVSAVERTEMRLSVAGAELT